MAEPKSEIDFHCPESEDVDDISDHQGFDAQQGVLTLEQRADNMIRCTWRPAEVDIRSFYCPTCGGAFTVFEPEVDSDVDLSSGYFSLKCEASSISFSRCPACPRIVLLLPDHSYSVHGIVPESQAEQINGPFGV